MVGLFYLLHIFASIMYKYTEPIMKIKEKVLSTLKGSPKNALLSRMIQLLFMKLNEVFLAFVEKRILRKRKEYLKYVYKNIHEISLYNFLQCYINKDFYYLYKKQPKKRIKLLEEQKKLQKKQQELNKEYQKNNPLKISFIPQVDRSSVTILQNGKLAANNYKTNLFINGRAVDSAELQKIDPARISTMNVITDNNLNTVKIYTK